MANFMDDFSGKDEEVRLNLLNCSDIEMEGEEQGIDHEDSLDFDDVDGHDDAERGEQ